MFRLRIKTNTKLTVTSHRHDEASEGGGNRREGISLRVLAAVHGGGHQAELLHRSRSVQRQLVRHFGAERPGCRHTG